MFSGGLLELQEEVLWEGLQLGEWWECLPGEWLDLHLLLEWLHLDLGLLFVWGDLSDRCGYLALLL